MGAVSGKYEGDDKDIGHAGAFLTTLCAFFLAEIGDKTQIATIGLAARFEVFCPVVTGTTLGMMLANVPALLIRDGMADKLPVKAMRIAAAILFPALGGITLAPTLAGEALAQHCRTCDEASLIVLSFGRKPPGPECTPAPL
jgi:putative Ca2+/H+ antiporter (TMEM165/GDT1 family)